MKHRTTGNRLRWLVVGTFAAILLWPDGADAQKKENEKPTAAEALSALRQPVPAGTTTPGSLWNPQGRFANLASDNKARKVNDLITIDIVEATEAQGAGAMQADRELQASSGINNLLGPVGTRSLRMLFSPQSASTAKGQAQTSSSMVVRTRLAGRIAEVLPNGLLVAEAVRTVEANRERQQVLVRGLVRPEDIAADNSVPSTALANLEVQLSGKGVISDGTRPSNFLVRLLLRILGL